MSNIKQTELFKKIQRTLRIGIGKEYALLYMHDNDGDFYKVTPYDDGPSFFRYMTDTSDSILEMRPVFCWGLMFKGLFPNQQLVIFEDVSRKHFYGVPLFQPWTSSIGPILKDDSLYYQKFISDYEKCFDSKKRKVIFRANDLHYCIMEKHGSAYYPLGYALISYINHALESFGFIEEQTVESVESRIWSFKNSTLAALLDDSLNEYFPTMGEK